eukprot:CAMPEP_0114163292 /NCGR_PEP_ID=MMETSP0043_2-20121206/30006_1 /TAXON_ID=464988 /ORGANISM="Hemiselmis andersenii, Strain CCMP644" /LENGTH=47 /DNA_ID= /DNA_START= /DNA_END= /DNA_ORIENTATION=
MLGVAAPRADRKVTSRGHAIPQTSLTPPRPPEEPPGPRSAGPLAMQR